MVDEINYARIGVAIDPPFMMGFASDERRVATSQVVGVRLQWAGVLGCRDVDHDGDGPRRDLLGQEITGWHDYCIGTRWDAGGVVDDPLTGSRWVPYPAWFSLN